VKQNNKENRIKEKKGKKGLPGPAQRVKPCGRSGFRSRNERELGIREEA
jgi:hypothetical protein